MVKCDKNIPQLGATTYNQKKKKILEEIEETRVSTYLVISVGYYVVGYVEFLLDSVIHKRHIITPTYRCVTCNICTPTNPSINQPSPIPTISANTNNLRNYRLAFNNYESQPNLRLFLHPHRNDLKIKILLNRK